MMQAPNYELSSYTPAQLLLPSYINSCAEETIKFINYNWRGLLRIISWDDANIPIGPNLTLLPVFQDGGGGYVRGLLIQRIENQGDIPTYTVHKCLIPPPLQHVGDDLDQRLLTSPVIRLV